MSEEIISIGAKAFSEEQIKLTLPSYENLKMQIEEIRSNAEIYRDVNDKKNKQFNNTIGIFGERGTGKTSVAYTIIDSLEEGKDIILPIIEPDTYGKSTTILGVILKFLKDEMDKLLKEIRDSKTNDFTDFFRDCVFKENNPLKVRYNDILEYFSYKDDLYREVMLTSYTDMTSYKKKYSYILAPDYAFKEKIREFIDELIKVKRKLNEGKEPLIIILVDDIDLKTSKCKELMEALMAYTCHANVICLLLGDYEILGESLALALLAEEEMKPQEYQEDAIFRDIYKSLAERKRYLSDEYLKKILPPAFRHSVVKWNKENIPNFKFNKEGKTLKELLNIALKEGNIFYKKEVEELVMNNSYEIFDKTARGLVNVYYSLNRYVNRVNKVEKKENGDEGEKKQIDIFSLKKSLIDSVINSSSELIKIQKNIYDNNIFWGNNEENTRLNFGKINFNAEQVTNENDDKKKYEQERKRDIEDNKKIFVLLELTRKLLNKSVEEGYMSVKNKYLYEIGKENNMSMICPPDENTDWNSWKEDKYEAKMWDKDKGIFNELIYNSKLDDSIIFIENLGEYKLKDGYIKGRDKAQLFKKVSEIIFSLDENKFLEEMYKDKDFYKKTLEFLEGYANEKRDYDLIRVNIANDFEEVTILGSYIPKSEEHKFNIEYDNIIFNTILLVREASSREKELSNEALLQKELSQKIVKNLFSNEAYSGSNEIKGLKESLVDIRMRKKLEDSLKEKINKIFEKNSKNVLKGIYLNKDELREILGNLYDVGNGYNTILYKIRGKLENEITIVEYVDIVAALKYHIYISKSMYGKKEAKDALYYIQNNTYVKDDNLTYQDIRLILEYMEYMVGNDIEDKKIGIEKIEDLKEKMRESLKKAEEEAIKEEMEFNEMYGIIVKDDEEEDDKKQIEEKISNEGLDENEQ